MTDDERMFDFGIRAVECGVVSKMADHTPSARRTPFPRPWRFDDEGDLVAADGTLPLVDEDGMALLLRAVNGCDGAATALRIAAAQLKEEAHPDEFTPTARESARRTVEAALATLRYGGGEEHEE